MDAAGQSPFIKGIQEMLDKIASTVNIGSSLDNMFIGLNAALQQITPAWEALKNSGSRHGSDLASAGGGSRLHPWPH